MPDKARTPLCVINSVAPIRICDNGGWTDTWFAKYGKIFNIGVYPYVEVQIEVYPYDGQDERIINAQANKRMLLLGKVFQNDVTLSGINGAVTKPLNPGQTLLPL